MNKAAILFSAALCVVAGTAQATDAAGKRYIAQLTSGGPESIRQAAESIYHTNYTDQKVLDVAADVLAKGYKKNSSNAQQDALAWICRALGNSHNGRYKAIVGKAAEADSRKLRKHCGNAADDLPASSGASFKGGSTHVAKESDASDDTAAKPAHGKKGKGSFSNIREGMSMDEVVALIGQPTATTSHLTGKAWIPFNFKGSDTVRLYALYKGRGRIIYSKESAYTSTFRVVTISPDANESGYP